MDALRTAVVLVLLLALGYGVWVVLSHDGGVEEPPEFDWSTEMADGASGFGEGPFVPPADGEGGGEFQFGTGPTPTGPTPTDSADNMFANTANTSSAAPSDGAPYGGDVIAAGGDAAHEIPPPPPGFAANNQETAAEPTSPPATQLPDTSTAAPEETTSSPATSVYAEPPAPAETANEYQTPNTSSRYGDDAVAESGSATPSSSIPSSGSIYAGSPDDEAPAPASDGIPAKSTPLPSNETALTTVVVSEVITEAKTSIAANEHYEALYALSQEYRNPIATEAERKEMTGMLDRLAGKVIYSTEHLLEPAHVVRRGEDLHAIADEMGVPYQLLQNINAISDPKLLTPGTSLKVVRGPFRAEVDLSGGELTLFLGPLYAGRFPISIGAEPSPTPGEYEVRDKEQGKAYFGANGASFPADHPANPYGRFWIDLGNQICIHGTASAGEQSGMGCVSLSPRDAADVFGILSAGSKVQILR